MNDFPDLNDFVILADESAVWAIAGLRQLDRLILEINDFASTSHRPRIHIFWKPGMEPAHGRVAEARFVEIETLDLTEPLPSTFCLLSTHVCIFRDGLPVFAERAGRVDSTSTVGSWNELFEMHQSRCQQDTGPDLPWRFVSSSDGIEAAETDLLKNASKAQDGFISEWINRPISRAVARQLLRFPIRPNQWTFAILVLPLLAIFFLGRGDYAGFVIGALLFHLFSILDGCDGEIARAKYLESPHGARVDHVSDHIGNILFLLGLSIGLYRHYADNPVGQLYCLEGIVCAIVITIHELILWRWSNQGISARLHVPSAYHRHKGMLEHSGIGVIGAQRVGLLVKVTKRDAAIVVFLLLAIAGLPQWILHLWLAVTLGSFILTGVAMARSSKLSLL